MKEFSEKIKSIKEKRSQEPVTLVKIVLPGEGEGLTLRLASRGGIKIDGTVWHDLISDIGKIDAKPTATNEALHGDTHFRLVVLNEKTDLFNPVNRVSSIFSNYCIERSVVTVYQYFFGQGMAEEDLGKLFVGTITGPEEWDGQICKFDVISLGNIIGKETIGRVITEEDYPEAPVESVGRFLPIPIGKVMAPGIPVHKTAETKLTTVLLPTDATARVLSTGGFPSRGKFLIGEYEISYTGKTATTFTGCSGAIEIHYKGDQVLEKIADYPYVFFDKNFPAKSIGKVYNQGHLVPNSDYSVDLAKGLVTFKRKPHFLEASDSRFWYSHFDRADSTNNSTNPTNAIDSNDTTDSAEIDKNKRIFAVKQADDLENKGQIGRVFLQVSHRANGAMKNDYLAVRIGGVSLGRLSKPGSGDAPSISGSPDFSLSVVDTLAVNFTDSDHSHTNSLNNAQAQNASAGVGTALYRVTPGWKRRITFPDFSGTALRVEYSVKIHMANTSAAAKFKINGVDAISFPARTRGSITGSRTINHQLNYIDITCSLSSGPRVEIQEASRTVHFSPASISSSRTGNSVTKSGGVSVSKSAMNMSNVKVSGSTNSVNDLIEITDKVRGSWGWFKDKVLSIKYTGSSSGRTVYIIVARIVIEFVANKIVYSDKVAALIEGVKDDSDGTITGTASAMIEKPDHVFKWSLLKLLEKDPTIIHADSFKTAGGFYTKAITGGYKFSGLIDSKQEVRRIWEKLARECRSIFYFSLGLARIYFRSSVSGDEVKTLDRSNILHQDKKSPITFKRTPIDQLANSIDLKFKRNWSELRTYDGVVHTENDESISQYGIRERAGRFDFDFVSNKLMASDLAGFYLSEYKQAWLWIQCECFLGSMDLEAYDHILVDHDHLDIDGNKFPGQVMGASRQLGLGAKKRPDIVKLAIRISVTGAIIAPDIEPTKGIGSVAFSRVAVASPPIHLAMGTVKGYGQMINPETIRGSITFDSQTAKGYGETRIQGVSIITKGHPITKVGDVSPDTSIKKFGSASAKFNGSGYLTIPAHEDWHLGMNYGSYTVDFWYRPAVPFPASGTFFSIDRVAGATSNYKTFFSYYISGRLFYQVMSRFSNGIGSVARWSVYSNPVFVAGIFNHVALVYDESIEKTLMFINGRKKYEYDKSGNPYPAVVNGKFYIGFDRVGSGMKPLDGHLDEFRVSGVARWSSDFSPPMEQHTNDRDTRLLLHMNSASGAVTFIDSAG